MLRPLRITGVVLALLTACFSDDTSPIRAFAVDTSTPKHEVDRRYLSYTVDTGLLVGGVFWDTSGKAEGEGGGRRVPPFPFENPKLRRLAKELAPYYLRIGGTAADETFYDLSSHPVTVPPDGYQFVLTAAHWANLTDFARDLGLTLVFGIGAGTPGRDESGAWVPDQAELLVRHAVARKDPVKVWELGNELNGYPAVHIGRPLIPVEQYTADFVRFRELLDNIAPNALLAGADSAYWPGVGEIGLPAVDEPLLESIGHIFDIVTWHYYPMQSRRCPIAVRRASLSLALDDEMLDEVRIWAPRVQGLQERYAPQAETWLGETGGAQCGGEPELSDRFVGGFWWLDQLGYLASLGHKVVARQGLSGSDYGLLRENDFDPNPDYYNSLLWRRLMGTKVLRAAPPPDSGLRVFAHCTASDSQRYPQGAVAVLLLNTDHLAEAEVAVPAALGAHHDLYQVTSDDLQSRTLYLNGTALVADKEGALPTLDPVKASGNLRLPPTSYTWAVFPQADAPACKD